MQRNLYLTIFMLLAGLFLTGCNNKNTASKPVEPPLGTITAVSFFVPRDEKELLGGYLPEYSSTVPAEALAFLDRSLAQELENSTATITWKPAKTTACREKVSGTSSDHTFALQYWIKVGECLTTDWLFIPQVLFWQEREGTNTGIITPASVTMDFYLINVSGGYIAKRFHFEETQQPLTANLLDAGKFFSRGGKWLTTKELAAEGLKQAIKGFGL